MTNERPPHIQAWENDYRQRGGLWRGTTNFVPPLPKPARVLDLGCGNGKNVNTLSLQPDVDVYAVDASPRAVQLCQDSVSHVGGKATCLTMDGTKLDFPDEFFDAVFCFHYLAHMPPEDRKQAEHEAARVLKKGGRLYFREFGTGDFRLGKGTATAEARTYSRKGGILTHYYTEDEVRHAFDGLLSLEKLEPERWTVLLRQKPYARERFHATFTKTGRTP